MNDSYVSLRWDDNSALETSYKVEKSSDGVAWSTLSGVSYAVNSEGLACTTIRGPYPLQTYYFRVSAYSDVLTASSAVSDVLPVSYTSTFAVTPTNIVATQSTTAFEVEVTWDAVTGAANYDIYRLASDATQPVYLGSIAASSTTYTDTTVPADGSYIYSVIARNASNTASNPGSAAATDAYFAEGDFDDDGLTNVDEFSLGTDPANYDTDDDGLPDAWEVLYDYEPNNPDSNNNGTPDGSEDDDSDGVYNFQEYASGSAPDTADAGGESGSSSPDFGNFKLTVGDKSVSLSETWTITAVDRTSGGIAATVTSPLADYASVSEKFYAGHTYDIAMTHASGPGDMDWTANVEFADDNNLPYAIFEEVEIDENGKEIKLFGTHLSPDDGDQKTAQLWIPKLDAEIASDVVWVKRSNVLCSEKTRVISN